MVADHAGHCTQLRKLCVGATSLGTQQLQHKVEKRLTVRAGR